MNGGWPIAAPPCPAADTARAPAGPTVHAQVKNGKIANLSFSVFTLCGIGGSGGSNTDAVAVKGVKIKANGSYRHSEKGDSSNGKATYTLKGKVTKRKITGSIEQFFRGGCQTFELKFTAKRRWWVGRNSSRSTSRSGSSHFSAISMCASPIR